MDTLIDKEFSLPTQLGTARDTYWQMALVAHQQHHPSLVLLQEVVNHLAEKARREMSFTSAEKTFLVALLESPWWGGQNNGFNESKLFLNPNGDASSAEQTISSSPSVRNIEDLVQLSLAKMMRHYISGGGQLYALDLSIYRNSVIVRDSINALKNYIREQFAYNKPAVFLATDDVNFLNSSHAGKIEKSRLQCDTKGFIFTDGTLLLEQKDPRLRNIANRFKISAMTHPVGPALMTQWRIEGRFDFESFAGNHEIMELPFTEDLLLQIPSGLCHHLAALGVARPFDYFASWSERY